MNFSLYDIDCPHCKKIVWVNNGDTSDCTVADVSAITCPWCSKAFWIDEEFAEKEYNEENDTETICDPADYADEGYKSPNEAAHYKE